MGQIRPKAKEKTQALSLAAPGEKAGEMTNQDMEIAAYFHWLGRGCPSDDALTDWIQVEGKWGGESINKGVDP